MKFYPSADDFTQALLVMLVTNFTSGQDFLELQALVLFCGIKNCLCPGMFWGAIDVISNDKCEWSNVENIISSPVKGLLGPSRIINGQAPENSLMLDLHFSLASKSTLFL